MVETSTAALKQGNVDIEAARKNASFPVDLLTTLLRGGPEALDKLNRLRAIVEKEPLLDRSKTVFMSREEVKFRVLSVVIGVYRVTETRAFTRCCSN